MRRIAERGGGCSLAKGEGRMIREKEVDGIGDAAAGVRNENFDRGGVTKDREYCLLVESKDRVVDVKKKNNDESDTDRGECMLCGTKPSKEAKNDESNTAPGEWMICGTKPSEDEESHIDWNGNSGEVTRLVHSNKISGSGGCEMSSNSVTSRTKHYKCVPAAPMTVKQRLAQEMRKRGVEEDKAASQSSPEDETLAITNAVTPNAVKSPSNEMGELQLRADEEPADTVVTSKAEHVARNTPMTVKQRLAQAMKKMGSGSDECEQVEEEGIERVLEGDDDLAIESTDANVDKIARADSGDCDQPEPEATESFDSKPKKKKRKKKKVCPSCVILLRLIFIIQ